MCSAVSKSKTFLGVDLKPLGDNIIYVEMCFVTFQPFALKILKFKHLF